MDPGERRRLFLERHPNYERDRKRRHRAAIKARAAARAAQEAAEVELTLFALPAPPVRLALPAPAELPEIILPVKRPEPVLVEATQREETRQRRVPGAPALIASAAERARPATPSQRASCG